MSVTFADTEKDDHVEEKEVSPEQRERAREKIKYANIRFDIILLST